LSFEGLHIPLFEGLDESERTLVSGLATRIEYDDGAVLIREGDPGRGLFLLASGTVAIAKQTIEGEQETLAVLEPGECFGDMALVDYKPRSATVTAVGAAEVYAFEQTVLDQFFVDQADIHLKILRNLVRITSSRLRFSDENLVQSAYDTIIEIDADLLILKHTRVTGRTSLIDLMTPEDAILGHPLFDVVPRLGEGVRQQLNHICGQGERGVMSLEFEHDGGEIGFYEVTVAPGAGADDPVYAAMGIRNVTETKALETRLIQTEKLAMTGQMAAEIGHELRNYLTVLIGHVDLMAVNPDVKGNERAIRSIGIMGEQLERVETFATGLMEMGVLKLEKESSDINLLIEKLTDFVRGQKRFRRVEFESQLDPNLPEMQADQGQIHQVLMNLYANAADAMDAGVIRTETGTEKEGSVLFVTVEDTGPGIPEERLERIFESGFTTKKTGHGFGLAVCRRIVENHQGDIEVNSVIGKGTTFRLTFNL
jgi:signal transduction histidine kinase